MSSPARKRNLTEEEMEGLIAFFRSSVGKAFVKKQPELMQRAAAVTQRATAGMVPKVMALEAEVMKEMRENAAEKAAPGLERLKAMGGTPRSYIRPRWSM